jgi:methyltransferase (TIGR00027 family)
MKESSVSSTSLLIARGVLLADATPALRPLLVNGSVAFTRRLLDVAGPSPNFELALRHRFLRRIIFGAERLLLPGVLLHWLTRKRLLDDYAHEALAAGCRQIVVLGAGLDTLTWRFQSKCVCLELDHPASAAFKRGAFPDGPELVEADLMQTSAADALRAHPRFDANQPTLFIAEGLLMYLSPARGASLFSELATVAAPGSRFAFSFMEARAGHRIGFHNSRHLVDGWLRWRGEPFRWALGRAEMEPFLAQHGWNLTAVGSPEEMRRRYLAPLGLDKAPLAMGEPVALAHRVAP